MGALGLRGGFPWTPRCGNFWPKGLEDNWDWSFSPKKSKGSGYIERGGPSKAQNEEGCPKNGTGGKK